MLERAALSNSAGISTLKRKSLSYFFLVCSAATLLCETAAGSSDSFCKAELTAADAASLVRLAVEHQIKDLKPHGTFSVDKNPRETDLRFYTFEALGVWSSKPGSAVIGNYSVNRKTATVWDMTSCKRIEFSALARLKKHYCSSLAVRQNADRTIRRDNPLDCTPWVRHGNSETGCH